MCSHVKKKPSVPKKGGTSLLWALLQRSAPQPVMSFWKKVAGLSGFKGRHFEGAIVLWAVDKTLQQSH
jgi:hypothetical protein